MKEGIDYEVIGKFQYVLMEDGNIIKNVEKIQIFGIDKPLLLLEQQDTTVHNRYNPNMKCDLTPIAVTLYDYIIGCEMLGQYQECNNAKQIFRKHWGEEYMSLVD